jgi:hypothetical protein
MVYITREMGWSVLSDLIEWWCFFYPSGGVLYPSDGDDGDFPPQDAEECLQEVGKLSLLLISEPNLSQISPSSPASSL